MLVFSGTFHDFNCVPSGRARHGFQYISLNLSFPCDGVVTKWKIGTENSNNQQVHLQIWRPVGTDYSRVAETVYTHSRGPVITEIPTDMTVSAGDVIGFFTPRNGSEGLRLALVPAPDHTLLQGMTSAENVSPVATFTDSLTTLRSSPLVSVVFSKLIMIGWYFVYYPLLHKKLYISISRLVFRIIPGQKWRTLCCHNNSQILTKFRSLHQW